MRRKFDFLGDMLERMGVPLMDAPTRELVDAFSPTCPSRTPGPSRAPRKRRG